VEKPISTTDKNSGGKPAGNSPETLPETKNAGQPLSPPAAVAPPLKFGGHKGGKKTKSGFPVGTPEHAEWCRVQEVERSRRRRAEVAAAITPPPLSAPPVSAAPGSVPPVLSASPAPAPGAMPPSPGGPVPIAGGMDSSAFMPPVEWTPAEVIPLVRQLTALADELTMKPVEDRIKRLPPKLVSDLDIMKDTEIEPQAKKIMDEGLAELSALGLNKAAVPVEYKPYMKTTAGVALCILPRFMLIKRLDKLIAQNEQMIQQGTPPQPEKKS
jgi:hypothetical protein